jgi:hypothetical protein
MTEALSLPGRGHSPYARDDHVARAFAFDVLATGDASIV